MADASPRLRTVGLLHLIVALAILLGTLHPLRDLLADRPFDLCRGIATIEAINGLGLVWLARSAALNSPGKLVAVGTTIVAAMGYWIVFTGTHPFDPLVPMGGAVMLAGWGWTVLRLSRH